MSKAGITKYSNYNKHALESATNTSTIKKHKRKVWLHFSRDSPLPFIKAIDALLYDYQTLGIGKGDSSEAKL